MARRKHVGKYETGGAHLKKTSRSKHRTALLSMILILSLAVGGTLAYIIARTNAIQNQFESAFVTCQVNANDNGTFDVTNTGDVDAYIRAAIVVNWMDSNGNVRGIAPVSTEYALTVNDTDWWQDTDTGYYYYKHSVTPSETSNDLISSMVVNVTAPSGYELSVEVVAEAIQAAGDTDNGAIPAYRDAWGIDSISG